MSGGPRAQPARVDEVRAAPLRPKHGRRPSFNLLRVACGEQHRLQRRGHMPGAQLAARRGQGAPADPAAGGLVERVVAHHVGQVAQAQCHLAHGFDVVALQVLLRRFTLDARLGREVVAAEEEREHSGRGELGGVGRPDHAREGVAVHLMHNRRAGLVQVGQVEAHRLERPAGCAVAAREARPDVLVRVNKEAQPVPAGFLDDGTHVVEVGLVVAVGATVFDGFPGDEEAQEGEAPARQAIEVLVGLGEREGTAGEGDGAMVEEAIADVGGAIRREGDFAAPTEVDTSQDQRAAVFIGEPGTGGCDHWMTSPCEAAHPLRQSCSGAACRARPPPGRDWASHVRRF